MPISIDWLPEPWDVGVSYWSFDLEEDGRDEILLRRSNGEMAALRWSDGEFTLDTEITPGELEYGQGLLLDGWDWDGDGRHDLTRIAGYGTVSMRARLGNGRLGPLVSILEPIEGQKEGPWEYHGLAVPIDIDQNGEFELFVSEVVADPASANPLEELSLYRRNGDAWEAFGPRVPFEPCGWIDAFAFGDFDEDGDEDLAIFDLATACDGYPAEYDPNWYRAGIFLADSEAGLLEFGSWVPAGGTYGDSDRKLWAEDIDGDGHLDLVMQVVVPAPSTPGDRPGGGVPQMSVLRGDGNGSFEAGVPVDLSPILLSSRVGSIGDFDGDGTKEWIIGRYQGSSAVMPLDFSPEGIAPLPAVYDAAHGGLSETTSGGGLSAGLDVNGDGVTDYFANAVFGAELNPLRANYVMVSAP